MKGFQLEIKGNWGHFKRPETNNNPLSFDIMPKTAFIGMVGAVLGIKREAMRIFFPQFCEDIVYGIQLLSSVKKESYGFTGHTAINPTAIKSPKSFEMLKKPQYLVCVGLKDSRSETYFESFKRFIMRSEALYTPVLGLHNCPAELYFKSEGIIEGLKNGVFFTKSFILAKQHKIANISDDLRIGFDRIPTFQNDDFWNLPERYVDIIYPDSPHGIEVEGDYYEYVIKDYNEKWILV